MGRTIAISVLTDDGLQSQLDPRFGRAAHFLIAEEKGSSWTVRDTVNNTAKNDAHGAGGAAAALLSGIGVDAVISGQFGPKAYQALDMLKIQMWIAHENDTAEAALAAFAEGRLTAMTVKVY